MKDKIYDINKEGDELIIKMKIYNPKTYDLINKKK